LRRPQAVRSLGCPLNLCGRRALLLFAPSVSAILSPATTSAPIVTATRLGLAPILVATFLTSPSFAEVVAAPTALTPRDRRFDIFWDDLGVGTPRPQEAQRGAHKGSARELYRLTPRDRAGVQTSRQVVEEGCPFLVSVRQQRNFSFPRFPNRLWHVHDAIQRSLRHPSNELVCIKIG
jgi:hypothetical protein